MLALTSIFVPKAADVLAEKLREQILQGQLHEGTLLPNERDLATRASLSRASVREALRILEVEGLITTRTGRNGGSEVVRPSSATVQRSIGIFIRGQQIRLEAVLETREAIEPRAAHLAALHHSAQDFEDLEKCHAKLEQASASDDIPAFLQANLDWHVQVVRAGHNELLIAFITAISQSVYAATDLDGFNAIDGRNAVILAHRRVMNAIKAGDASAAARRMGRHVAAYIGDVQRNASTEALKVDGLTRKL